MSSFNLRWINLARRFPKKQIASTNNLNRPKRGSLGRRRAAVYYCYPREDENGESAPIYHDGKFIGCLYDRADTQTALAELAYRDKYRAERSAKVQAESAARAIEDAEIKERCKASGCVRKWGEPCKHTLKFSRCPEYLRYHEETESDPWN